MAGEAARRLPGNQPLRTLGVRTSRLARAGARSVTVPSRKPGLGASGRRRQGAAPARESGRPVPSPSAVGASWTSAPKRRTTSRTSSRRCSASAPSPTASAARSAISRSASWSMAPGPPLGSEAREGAGSGKARQYIDSSWPPHRELPSVLPAFVATGVGARTIPSNRSSSNAGRLGRCPASGWGGRTS